MKDGFLLFYQESNGNNYKLRAFSSRIKEVRIRKRIEVVDRMKESDKLYAVIDLETTGSSYSKGHRIIQVGMTLLQKETVVQEYNFIVNPGLSIPPLIEKLTGISNKDVRDAPYFEDIAPFLYNLIQDCIFVAHNIAFDYHFLDQSFQKAGLAPLTLKGMDTVELAKILYPTLSSYRLSDLSKKLHLQHQKVHDAAGDAHATAELFLLLKKKAVNLPLVTLEKMSVLKQHTQKNNADFFEMCLQEAREVKRPLPETVVIKNGIALRRKKIDYEQTGHRLKESLHYEDFRNERFFKEMDFQRKAEQIELMDAVQAFLSDEKEPYTAMEAPTGIGKTLAYLLPAVLQATPAKKVVVSTSTLILQEQIQEQELQKMKKVLPFSFQTASLVGKSNLLHLEKFSRLELTEMSRLDALVTMSLYVWLTETEIGDLSELSPSHQAGSLFEKITYAKEETGNAEKWQENDFYFYNQARAEQASILVTNHSYLCHHFEDFIHFSADQQKPILIADEAHRLPFAYQEKEKISFSLSAYKKRALKLASDTLSYREYLEKNATEAFPQYELLNYEFSLERLFQTCEEWEKVLLQGPEKRRTEQLQEKGNVHFIESDWFNSPQLQRKMKQVLRSMKEVETTGTLYLEAENFPGSSQFSRRVQTFLASLKKEQTKLRKMNQESPTAYHYLACSFENQQDHYELIYSDFDLGDSLNRSLTQNFRKTLFISASLLLREKKEYFAKKVGVTDLPARSFSRSQEMEEKIQLLVPSDIPPVPLIPEEKWIRMIVDLMSVLSQHAERKTLLLFNSHAVLEKVFMKIKENEFFKHAGMELLAQGFSGSRRRMKKRFSEAEKVLLLGAGTYWEGVDFSSIPIEMLIMTRLPFDPPDTPENAAIREYYAKIGGNAFQSEYLPKMLMRLTQGLGRVARGGKKEGVILCLDTRLLHSSYSRQIKNILPESVRIQECPFADLAENTNLFFEKKKD